MFKIIFINVEFDIEYKQFYYALHIFIITIYCHYIHIYIIIMKPQSYVI